LRSQHQSRPAAGCRVEVLSQSLKNTRTAPAGAARATNARREGQNKRGRRQGAALGALEASEEAGLGQEIDLPRSAKLELELEPRAVSRRE